MSMQNQLRAGYESTDGQIDEQADRRTVIRTDRQNDSYIHVPPELRLRGYKNLFLQNRLANFNQTWHKATLIEENASLFK